MAEQQQSFLVPLDTYLKVGLHIGTKFRTTYMDPFIYKIRPDGLAVLNIQEIDKRLAIAAAFIAKYEAQDIIVVGKRENSWRAIKLFSKATGIPCYPGTYQPGYMTNAELEEFIEPKLLIVTDPWPDKDAVKDAVMTGTAVIALCDTNNESNYIDLVVPCNNKGKKSLGLIFWVLAREYLKAKGKVTSDEDMPIPLDAFVADE